MSTNGQATWSTLISSAWRASASPGTGSPGIAAKNRAASDVPGGVRRTDSYPSGYSDGTSHRSSEIRQHCDVTGYAAPQNKFELKLPLPRDWNGNFFFHACGGFCGSVLSAYFDLGLMRGYASATGNGGHESAPGFDGIWAANAPELQEDFGWRSNHVVTLITKAITAHYFNKPIRHAYMAGNSKGGQAVPMEAQRFPEDFDGYMPSAPVYDYTGRNILAAAWFWQALHDGHGGSVLMLRLRTQFTNPCCGCAAPRLAWTSPQLIM